MFGLRDSVAPVAAAAVPGTAAGVLLLLPVNTTGAPGYIIWLPDLISGIPKSSTWCLNPSMGVYLGSPLGCLGSSTRWRSGTGQCCHQPQMSVIAGSSAAVLPALSAATFPALSAATLPALSAAVLAGSSLARLWPAGSSQPTTLPEIPGWLLVLRYMLVLSSGSTPCCGTWYRAGSERNHTIETRVSASPYIQQPACLTEWLPRVVHR